MKLLLASGNAHKAQEIRAILAGSGIELETLASWPDIPDPPETESTFEGNALMKARFVHERTGLVCVADDSGIEVDALNGRPGVHSKRYSPEGTAVANNALMLRQLAGHSNRTGRFRCVLALVSGPVELFAQGAVEGRILEALQGDGGFGYDPLFTPDEAPGRSMAELSMDEKNAISHRGRAFRQLPALLADLERLS